MRSSSKEKEETWVIKISVENGKSNDFLRELQNNPEIKKLAPEMHVVNKWCEQTWKNKQKNRSYIKISFVE